MVVKDHRIGSKNLPYTVNSFMRTISSEFFCPTKFSENYKQLEPENLFIFWVEGVILIGPSLIFLGNIGHSQIEASLLTSNCKIETNVPTSLVCIHES